MWINREIFLHSKCDGKQPQGNSSHSNLMPQFLTACVKIYAENISKA